MTHENITHLLRFAVNGSEMHRYGIALLSVILPMEGFVLGDTTMIQDSPYRPDQIASKIDRSIDGPHRKNITLRYWFDIVVAHDPRTDWKKKGLPCDDVIIIDLSDFSLDTPIGEIVKRIRSRLP